MARRLFNGRRFSENGWPYVDQDSCTWATVPGSDDVNLQIQNGPPLQLLRAWAADWNAYIEPLRDPDSACWTPGNSVATSNHPGGTAIDLNWNSHPFQKRGSLNAAQMATMAEMEAFYEGNVFWAGRWANPADEMHSQVGYNTYDQNADAPYPKVLDFIRRKIRADGFSTFKRGGTATPPAPPTAPPASTAVDVLAEVMGGTVSRDRYAALAPAVADALNKSDCRTVNRIAMWCAQIGHESVGLKYMKEIGDAAYFSQYNNRADLGNGPADGPRYPGRGPIQITGRHNYRKLSEWANSKGFVPTPTFFEDQPEKLELDQYAFLGAIWYWTVARPDINALSDSRDVVTVTKRINGGTNGLQDRQSRYSRAQVMGERLLALTTTAAPPTQGDDELSAEAEGMIREMYAEWRKEKRGPSRSFLATDGQGVESPLGFIYNIDGNVWTQQLTWAYLFHVPLAIEVVEAVAQNGAYEGTWAASEPFNAWLNEFGQSYCQGLVDFKAALVAKLTSKTVAAAPPALRDAVTTVREAAPTPVTNVTNVVDTRALESEIARLSDQFEQLRVAINNTPVSPPAASTGLVTSGKTPGQITGAVVDSVTDYTQHLLAMDAPERQGHLAALKALQPSNGDQS